MTSPVAQARSWAADTPDVGTEGATLAHEHSHSSLSYTATKPEISQDRDIQRLEEWTKRLSKLTVSERNRFGSLQVLMGMFVGVPFVEAAEILRTSPAKLTRWLHGRETIPEAKHREVVQVANILRHLHQVLEPGATEDWLHTPIPALDGISPSEAIRRRKLTDLATVAERYVDPSFS